jgi:hypothetical protein
VVAAPPRAPVAVLPSYSHAALDAPASAARPVRSPFPPHVNPNFMRLMMIREAQRLKDEKR